MPGFFSDIEKRGEGGDLYLEVLYTGPNSQLALVSLNPGEEMGNGGQVSADQFIRVEEGAGTALLDGAEHVLEAGAAVVIPAGASHTIANRSGRGRMLLYIVFSPVFLPEGAAWKTRAEAKLAGY